MGASTAKYLHEWNKIKHSNGKVFYLFKNIYTNNLKITQFSAQKLFYNSETEPGILFE